MLGRQQRIGLSRRSVASSFFSNDKLGIHRNSSVMSEEELSFQGEREYPEIRGKATISVMRISLQLDKVRVIPPYAERHLRWCESNENEIRSEKFCFPTYSILYPYQG